WVDDLLVKDRVCATQLRKLPRRMVLEDLGVLDVRVSPLGEEVELIDADAEGEEEEDGNKGSEGDDKVVEVVVGNGHVEDGERNDSED
ncbi:MAG: hypothetical protein Q9210_005704, partial [Variospora velana]